MFYIAVSLVNQNGFSRLKYTFHTEAKTILSSDYFLCETTNGIAIGVNPVIKDKPDFETKRAVRITEDIYNQARMHENISIEE